MKKRQKNNRTELIMQTTRNFTQQLSKCWDGHWPTVAQREVKIFYGCRFSIVDLMDVGFLPRPNSMDTGFHYGKISLSMGGSRVPL